MIDHSMITSEKLCEQMLQFFRQPLLAAMTKVDCALIEGASKGLTDISVTLDNMVPFVERELIKHIEQHGYKVSMEYNGFKLVLHISW